MLLGEIQYSNEAWDQVSLNGKDAVKRLLVVDPQQRALTTDILQHPWVKGDHATTEHLVVGQRRLGEFNIRRAALVRPNLDLLCTYNRSAGYTAESNCSLLLLIFLSKALTFDNSQFMNFYQ